MALESYIRDVPDFPQAGIVFKDITPLLADPEALHEAVFGLAAPWREAGVSQVAGIESRGFIFGALVARELGCGFVPIRKPGKLPWRTVSRDYQLEYGSDTVEIHEDALVADDRVVVVDDCLATGGTLHAALELVADLGATVLGSSVLMELAFLDGRRQIPGACHSLMNFAE